MRVSKRLAKLSSILIMKLGLAHEGCRDQQEVDESQDCLKIIGTWNFC